MSGYLGGQIGAVATSNPVTLLGLPPEQFVAGRAGCAIGAFGWVQSDGKTVLNKSPGGSSAPDGFVGLNQLVATPNFVLPGAPILLTKTADVWAASSTPATFGQVVAASLTTGAIQTVAPGAAAPSGYVLTTWIVTQGSATAGLPIIISNAGGGTSAGGGGGSGSSITSASASASGLSAGSQPSASAIVNGGTITFGFGIPAGATGATGPAGVTSATATASSLSAGASATASAVLSGGVVTFALGIPQGAPGAAAPNPVLGATVGLMTMQFRDGGTAAANGVSSGNNPYDASKQPTSNSEWANGWQDQQSNSRSASYYAISGSF